MKKFLYKKTTTALVMEVKKRWNGEKVSLGDIKMMNSKVTSI